MSKKRLFYSLIIFLHFILILQTALAQNFKCEKDGFFPDKHDCWIYHICVGATHSVKACKDDLLFNPNKNECDWAMNVNCTHTSPGNNVSSTVSTQNVVRPSDIVGNNNLASESLFDDLCRSVDIGYIAHPTDCKQYAYCANGVPQTKICKKSLLWSQAEKMCVWPAQSDCPVKIPTPSPLIAPTNNGLSRDTIYPPVYLPTNPPSSSLSICSSTKSLRLPDPYDCSIYHDCYQGTDLISYCPAQLQYNPEKQKCDHPHNVQCKNKCTMKNEGARFVDPMSCCHFYECMSNKLVSHTCSYPNLFDIQTRKCLLYKKVKCAGRRQCLNKCHYLSNHDNGKNSCESSPSCIGHSDGFYLDRTKANCQSYIQCLDYRVANYSRCAHGQRFNRNLGKCTTADQVPCPASSSSSIRFSLSICLLLITSTTMIL
ncbi:unnamed protein product [Adineta steineri]|uniref:Chitin-binding type-2 domain-containing protein n=1 Tax=Adineta steineri TaxID=433720 RepID=A0A818QFM7_9BILA|nr:unnamed protein product [Adineta steineri]